MSADTPATVQTRRRAVAGFTLAVLTAGLLPWLGPWAYAVGVVGLTLGLSSLGRLRQGKGWVYGGLLLQAAAGLLVLGLIPAVRHVREAAARTTAT